MMTDEARLSRDLLVGLDGEMPLIGRFEEKVRSASAPRSPLLPTCREQKGEDDGDDRCRHRLFD
jgi:hypothetical protein